MTLTRPVRLLAWLVTLGITLLLTAGCWDRAEINELAIVLASGIDWEDGHWVATAGIVQTTGEQAGAGQGGGTTGLPSRPAFVVSARGATVLEAQQNLRLFTARRPRWDHAAALIIGEAAAKHGIAEILDLWTRAEALRTTTMVGLVRGKAQDFIVESQPGLETSLGVTLPGILRLGNPMGISAVTTFHRIIRTLSSESHTSLVSLFGLVAQPQPPPLDTSAPPASPAGAGGGGNNEKGSDGGDATDGGGKQRAATDGSPSGIPQRTETNPASLVQQGRYLPPAPPLAAVQLQGAGIILKDKLVGYLDLHATRGVFWVTAPPNNAIISVSCPGPSEEPRVSVVIEDVRRDIKMSTAKAELKLRVTATLEGQACLRVKETGLVGPHAVGAEERLRVVAGEAAKHIEGEIRAALAATQPLGADVFGFAIMLNRQHREDWERVRDRWPEVYRHLPVSLEVEVKFVGTGLTIGPPTIADPPSENASGSSGGNGSSNDRGTTDTGG